MKYTELGKTGMKVSKFGLGGTALGGMYGQTELEECCKVVHHALEAGVNFIDTAPWYSKSEEVLGVALENIPRDSYFLATKCCRYPLEVDRMFDFSAERALASVDESLRKLKVDYVDIIQVHDMEFAPSLDKVIHETLPALQKVKEAGKARFIGITGYPMANYREVIERSPVKIDTILSYCHLTMNDSSLLDHLDYFKEKGIGVINASPISMGLLTHQGPPSWHPATDDIRKACAAAASYCQEQGVDLPRLAVAYAYAFDEVPVTLCSTVSLDLLKMNLETLEGPLTDLEKRVMEEVMERYFRPLKNKTWEGVELARYWDKINKSQQTI